MRQLPSTVIHRVVVCDSVDHVQVRQLPSTVIHRVVVCDSVDHVQVRQLPSTVIHRVVVCDSVDLIWLVLLYISLSPTCIWWPLSPATQFAHILVCPFNVYHGDNSTLCQGSPLRCIVVSFSLSVHCLFKAYFTWYRIATCYTKPRFCNALSYLCCKRCMKHACSIAEFVCRH